MLSLTHACFLPIIYFSLFLSYFYMTHITHANSHSNSLTNAPIHPFIHAPTNSLTAHPPLTHSPTHSLTHTNSPAFTHLLFQQLVALQGKKASQRRGGDFSDTLTDEDILLLNDRILGLEETGKTLRQKLSAADEANKTLQLQCDNFYDNLKSAQSGQVNHIRLEFRCCDK